MKGRKLSQAASMMWMPNPIPRSYYVERITTVRIAPRNGHHASGCCHRSFSTVTRSTHRCAAKLFSTHIWSTCLRIFGLQIRFSPRISGLHLRINGLLGYSIMLILKRMHFPLYACMNTLYDSLY